ncbi:MAG: phospholipase D-like domain-containing protein [Patescibacteria group bacterium]
MEFVRSAKKSVTVLAPSVSDDEFVKALNDAAEAGLKVRVCVLKDASEADLARFSDKVSAVRTSRAQLHAKTVLVDASALLIGSANFTQNSLDRNRETGAVFATPRTLRNYENTVFQDCKW